MRFKAMGKEKELASITNIVRLVLKTHQGWQGC
nr:MAG TPA: hypothetical protein [Caudoviricetes sp.]